MEAICIFFDLYEDLLMTALNQVNITGMVIISYHSVISSRINKIVGIDFILFMHAVI